MIEWYVQNNIIYMRLDLANSAIILSMNTYVVAI